MPGECRVAATRVRKTVRRLAMGRALLPGNVIGVFVGETRRSRNAAAEAGKATVCFNHVSRQPLTLRRIEEFRLTLTTAAPQ
jgi:hypothetical protein